MQTCIKSEVETEAQKWNSTYNLNVQREILGDLYKLSNLYSKGLESEYYRFWLLRVWEYLHKLYQLSISDMKSNILTCDEATYPWAKHLYLNILISNYLY